MKPLRRLVIQLLVVFALLGGMIGQVVAQQATFAAPLVVVNASFLNVRTGPGVQYTVLLTAVGGTEYPVLRIASDFVWYEIATDAGPGWVNVEFTLPRGDFSNVPIASVAEFNAALGQGGGGEGSTTATLAALNNYVVINTGFLNVRSGPSVGYSVVATVPGGAELAVIGRAPDGVWYLVEGAFGRGWLNSEFAIFRGVYSSVSVIQDVVANPEPSLTGNTVVINTSFLNVRSGPAVGYSSVATVSGGDELTILGRTPDGIWYLVEGAFGRGWLNSEYVAFRGEYSLVPIIDEVFILPVVATYNNRVVINTSFLNVRSGPAVGYSTVATVAGGDELTVIGRAPDGVWYYVEGTFGRGWLNNEFVVFRGDYGTVTVLENVDALISQAQPAVTGQVTGGTSALSATGNRVVINTGFLNVRSGPAVGYASVATVTGGDELAVIGRAPDGVWYYVEGAFGRGWLNNEYVVFRGDYGSVPVIRNVTATLSTAPTTEQTSTVTQGNYIIINTGNLNVRSGPAAGFSVVATVAGGTQLSVVGRASDNVWYYVEGVFGRGWLNSEFVIFRGNYDSVTVIDLSGN